MISEVIKSLATILITANDDKAIHSLPNLMPELNEALEPLLPESWQSTPVDIRPYGKGIECVFHLRKPGMGLDFVNYAIRFNRVDNCVDGTMEYHFGKSDHPETIIIRRMKLPNVISSEELRDWIVTACAIPTPVKPVKKYDVTFGMLVHYTVSVSATSEEEAIVKARAIDLSKKKPDSGMEELSADAEET